VGKPHPWQPGLIDSYNLNKVNKMKTSTQLALLSTGQFLCFSAVVLIISVNYTQYIDKRDSYKKQCFDKFSSFEYEVISDELYCKSGGKSIKYLNNGE